MATRIATANGNFTTAGTWAEVDATSLLDAENTSTGLTTSYVESQTFTPGAITIDGIAVKIASRAAAPGANTISVRLAQGGALVAGTEVTINVSDITARAGEQGWYFFKFAAPVTLVALTAYTVSAKASATLQVNLYRNATAGNWSRMLRTTTTGAPAAGDNLFILGEWTAAATKTDRTVTMDNTAATDFGGASTTLVSFGIGKGGTLAWGTTAATAYVLRLSGILGIWQDGLMTMGTTSTPCPRDSSQQLEFDCGADGDFGLKVWGTFIAQGLSRTSGKNIVQCLLNTDEAAAQTVLGVDTDTGWLNGDDIAIAGTTRASGANQGETRTLSGNATATTMTVTAGLTNAHLGTSPTQAEVILLTRNVRVQSVSSTFMAYVYFGAAAVVDCDWTSFRYLGTTTLGKRGVEVDTSSGSVALSYCSIRDFDQHGIYAGAADWDNLTIEHLTGYAVGHQAANAAGVRLDASSGSGNWSLSNITIISIGASAGSGLHLLDVKGQVSDIRCSGGAGRGVFISTRDDMPHVWDGFDLHSSQGAGMEIASIADAEIRNVTAWRCGAAGSSVGGIMIGYVFGRFVLDGGTCFGNGSRNIGKYLQGNGDYGTIRNMVFAGDSSFSTPEGFSFHNGAASDLTVARLENCTFGVASGIFVAHSTADLGFSSSSDSRAILTLVNTLLASATAFNNDGNLQGDSRIHYQRKGQVTGDHQTVYFNNGTVSLDTVLFRTATPSEKLAPANANAKLRSGVKRVAVDSGETVSISCYVQKNASYNGDAPRLILKANPALGVDQDQVIDSLSVGSGVWENLAGTTPAAEEDGVFEFYVDCDGTAGQVNVDDWVAA